MAIEKINDAVTKYTGQDCIDMINEIDRKSAKAFADMMNVTIETVENAGKEAEKYIAAQGEALLKLFGTADPEYTHKTLIETDSDRIGPWYRAANEAFQAGNYSDALALFANTKTIDGIANQIDDARKKHRLDNDGQEMTLSDFLSRYTEPPWSGVMTPEKEAAIREMTADGSKIDVVNDKPDPHPSIFDTLLQGSVEPAQITPIHQNINYGIMGSKLNRVIASKNRPPSFRNTSDQMAFTWIINQVPNDPKIDIKTVITLGIAAGDRDKYKLSRRISGDDEAILTSICNLKFNMQRYDEPEPHVITPEAIWRDINQIDNPKITPSPQQVNDIRRRVDKMRFTRMIMDMTDEINKGWIHPDGDQVTNGIYDDYLLPARYTQAITKKGRTVEGYIIDRMPYIYTYNIMRGNLAFIPADMLAVASENNHNLSYASYRNFMAREIAWMYSNPKKRNTIISFDSIYNGTQTPTPEERVQGRQFKSDTVRKNKIRQIAKNDRDDFIEILTAWKNKGYIADFVIIPEGKTTKKTGVKIKLTPERLKAKSLLGPDDPGQGSGSDAKKSGK